MPSSRTALRQRGRPTRRCGRPDCVHRHRRSCPAGDLPRARLAREAISRGINPRRVDSARTLSFSKVRRPELSRVAVLAAGDLRPALTAFGMDGASSARRAVADVSCNSGCGAAARERLDGAFAHGPVGRRGRPPGPNDPVSFSSETASRDLAAELRLPTMFEHRSISWRRADCWPMAEHTWMFRRLAGGLRGQDPQGDQARRSCRRAAHQVRADHQSQDRQGPRAYDPAVTSAAGGSGDRVMERRPDAEPHALTTLAFAH